jgi:hypothetical protein
VYGVAGDGRGVAWDFGDFLLVDGMSIFRTWTMDLVELCPRLFVEVS